MPVYRAYASTHEFVANNSHDAEVQARAMFRQGRFWQDRVVRIQTVETTVAHETDPTTGIVYHGNLD